MARHILSVIKTTEIGNKTANINIKNNSFFYDVNSTGSKTTKIIKRW